MKRIAFVCDRYIAFNQFRNSGILENLAITHKILILTSSRSYEQIRTNCPDSIEVIEIYNPDELTSIQKSFIRVFSMVYDEKYRINYTGVQHRKARLIEAVSNFNLMSIPKIFEVLASKIFSYNKIIRDYFLRFISVINSEYMLKRLQILDLNLIVTSTAGLGIDGIVISAARKISLPTIACFQSWDRTASKGFPLSKPNFCTVWNEKMKMELEMFSELQSQNIVVVGSPFWDFLRLKLKSAVQPRICTNNNILIGLNGPATHSHNIDLINFISNYAKQTIKSQHNYILRVHPEYISNESLLNELHQTMEKIQSENYSVHIYVPRIDNAGKNDFLTREIDKETLFSQFLNAKLTISTVSTWMIETAIFNLPNLCLKFGRYETNLLKIDLNEYLPEHISRILSYDANYVVNNFSELKILLDRCILDEHSFNNLWNEKVEQRKKLVEGELGSKIGTSLNDTLGFIETILN